MGIAEPFVYALAAGVGVGRMVDRRHWLSDTVLGIAFGYAAGREVAVRSSHREQKSSPPTVNGSSANGLSFRAGPGGLALSWQKTF
jgi:hypothetical protein